MNKKLTCAIITPVGPGHRELFNQMSDSVDAAISHSRGAFQQVDIFAVNDTRGQLGRSAARNIAVREASTKAIDWIFFLDADDLMATTCFTEVSPFLTEYDAIWGQIFEYQDGKVKYRQNQLAQANKLTQILSVDPFLTLQMGHFVKTTVAIQNPFREDMNTGEDFEYYLRLWKHYKCSKQLIKLFYNRRFHHSKGPKSADGAEWRKVVMKLIDNFH